MATRVPMRPAARTRNPANTGRLPSGGTDDAPSVYPVWGTYNWRDRLNESRRVATTFARNERPTLLWIGALTLGCVLMAGLLMEAGYELPAWWQLVALAVVTAATERQSVRVAKNVETSVAFLPFVFAAVAFGPLTALVVGVAANALDFRRPYLRWAIYIPARGLTGGATGLFAAHVLGSGRPSFAVATLATVVAGVTNVIVDGLFNVATLLVRRSAPVMVYIRSVGPFALLSLPLYVPLVGLMVYGYFHYSFWTAAMFLGPTLALQRVVHLYQRQRDVSMELVNANERLEAANLSFAAALVATLDARDRYTAGHSEAVATYARAIAERLSLSEREQHLVFLCGLVHDVGKVGLPPGLLEKPGPLTLEERRQMEEHSVIGERILANVEDYKEIAQIVRNHHERIDGHGYPDGLVGDEIPLLSRILAVADAFDAMTSDRPYRDAMPQKTARLRLAQAAGSQLDPNVVLAFESILSRDVPLLHARPLRKTRPLVAVSGVGSA
jgi:putative nucleotidyltransferase with HDIG domain